MFGAKLANDVDIVLYKDQEHVDCVEFYGENISFKVSKEWLGLHMIEGLTEDEMKYLVISRLEKNYNKMG